MKICIVKLGDFVEGLISVVTFGWGKEVATETAMVFGYKDCGCDKRKAWLNKIVGCGPSQIKLNFDEKYIDDSGNGGSNGFASKKSGHPLSKY
jgi:hypothetical protein